MAVHCPKFTAARQTERVYILWILIKTTTDQYELTTFLICNMITGSLFWIHFNPQHIIDYLFSHEMAGRLSMMLKFVNVGKLWNILPKCCQIWLLFCHSLYIPCGTVTSCNKMRGARVDEIVLFINRQASDEYLSLYTIIYIYDASFNNSHWMKRR